MRAGASEDKSEVRGVGVGWERVCSRDVGEWVWLGSLDNDTRHHLLVSLRPARSAEKRPAASPSFSRRHVTGEAGHSDLIQAVEHNSRGAEAYC